MLAHENLRKILHYSIVTGQFTRLITPSNNVKIGVINSVLHQGYMRIMINQRSYAAHRLAWFWVMGEWPKHQIDHKNGVSDANYWLNLREATHSQNQQNRGLASTNTSGRKGVHWNKARKKWTAQITLNNKRKHLGCFDDIESAYYARLKAEKDLHGDFARI